jgi:predicted GIY-YIG superfamily endonuclease
MYVVMDMDGEYYCGIDSGCEDIWEQRIEKAIWYDTKTEAKEAAKATKRYKTYTLVIQEFEVVD